jgi:hypothetical protein
MKAVFRTSKDSPHAVEIPGIGYAGPKGKGEIVVEAAAFLMPELQNDKGEPLSGAELTAAAKEFAAARGLEVANVKNEQVEDVDTEAVKAKAEQLAEAKPDEAEPATGEEK